MALHLLETCLSIELHPIIPPTAQSFPVGGHRSRRISKADHEHQEDDGVMETSCWSLTSR